MYKSIHKNPISQHRLQTGICQSSGSHGSPDQNSEIYWDHQTSKGMMPSTPAGFLIP